jgi:hypothetical protein
MVKVVKENQWRQIFRYGGSTWHPFGGNGFTSKKFYAYIYDLMQAHPVLKLIWGSQCTPRIKFFVWLISVRG